MQGRSSSTVDTETALAAFLRAHVGVVERNDVGPLIGQAALVGERGVASIVSTVDLQAGVNLALTGASAALPAGMRSGATH
jgi:hypothetical protein